MALPVDARNMKVKARLPVPSIATSGRWNKRADGEWGFDLDDPPNQDDKASNSNMNSATASDDDDEIDQNTISKDVNNVRNNLPSNMTAAATPSSSNQNIPSQASANQTASKDLSNSSITNETTTTTITSNTNLQQISIDQASFKPIHLVLRMRDEKRELQDIKFDFLPNKDTVDEISHELVNAKLIDAIDMIAVSANLNKLLQNHSLSPITFSLVF